MFSAATAIQMSSPFPPAAQLGKPVCVFCGSSPGKVPLFSKASESVGRALARASIPLVYGGGRRGIMGVVSQSALSAGGYVHGIVPNALVERASEFTPAPGTIMPNEVAHVATAAQSKEGTGEDIVEDGDHEKMTVQVVGTMHERKLAMATLSTGGFIVLPGGYGTFEEALEMITWNQLGIHRLPILILNIGNFYTNLYEQFQSSVEAGFIAPENLSLLKLVDLEGGAAANGDESRAEEWGDAALKALKEWSFDPNSAYKLDWEIKGNKSEDQAKKSDKADNTISKTYIPSYIFTTMRFSSNPETISRHPLSVEGCPLYEAHFERLKEAQEYYRARENGDVGANWPCVGLLRDTMPSELTSHWSEPSLVDRDSSSGRQTADWRVRMILHRYGGTEVQVLRAPQDAGPFQYDIPPTRPESKSCRPLVLDPKVSDIGKENRDQKSLRLYKTNERAMYDEAYARGAKLSPNHPEVLLRTSTHILETTTSNIAIQQAGSCWWITPRITPETPLLNGVMRQYLLDAEMIQEGSVTVEDYERAKREGGRLIGFNGLRGVWEARWV